MTKDELYSLISRHTTHPGAWLYAEGTFLRTIDEMLAELIAEKLIVKIAESKGGFEYASNRQHEAREEGWKSYRTTTAREIAQKT